jgi:predicted peptidase
MSEFQGAWELYPAYNNKVPGITSGTFHSSYVFLFMNLNCPLFSGNLNPALRLCFIIAAFSLTCCKKPGVDHEMDTPVKNVPSNVTPILKPVVHPITDNIGGYYIALPSNYEQTNSSYPLLVFIHGAGQFGNGSLDLPLLLNDGPAQLVDEKRFPGVFKVNGHEYSFIILMPQTKSFAGNADIAASIEFAKQTYRVDSSRIYLSGLSSGSEAICNYGAVHANSIAAIIPMAGVPADYASTDKCKRIAEGNLPVWAFHSEDDQTINVSYAKGFIASITSFHPSVMPKLTLWASGGHDAWTRAIDPSYNSNGMNIYEWMLQYHR